MVSAKIIADSISPSGNRITSFILVFPRYILAEVNTHRAFSRNSASSRAIPFKKMVEMVMENPFIPIKFMKEHKGMQGTEYFDCRGEVGVLREHWLEARDKAVESAIILSNFGLTKQMCNRLLEPFMWHVAIVTATDFENFFSLRLDAGADIHFQMSANKMLGEMQESKPKQLYVGDWHIPFGDSFDIERINNVRGDDVYLRDSIQSIKIKIATARCARVSYLNYEGTDDYQKDIELHDTLLKSGHMSPFEHCAECTGDNEYYGNFSGFKQYRKFINNENKTYKI